MIKYFVILTVLFCTIPQLNAQQVKQTKGKEGLLNKLFSPGPLMLGHKNLEGTTDDCLQCHTIRKGVPDQKCLDCHKEIAKSRNKKSSFHKLVKKNCFACHSDHKGRQFDSAKVDQKKFDHSRTGFKLGGKHKEISCKECHTQTRTAKKLIRVGDIRYFGLDQSCKSCHQKDDIHKFKGKWDKKDCNACHNDVKWDQVPLKKFDHKKDAKYELKGKHAELKCQKCHLSENKKFSQYEWKKLKKDNCLSCHDDFHKKKLSPKFRNGECQKCHNYDSWKIKNFKTKHQVTGYPLKGKHKQIKCIECHKQSKGLAAQKIKHYNFNGLNKQCTSCHQDYHGFRKQTSSRFGKLANCQTCHDEVNWKDNVDFNHNLDTRWKIDGQHQTNQCFQCHVKKGKGLQLKYKEGKKSQFVNQERPNIERVYQWRHLPMKTCNSCHANPHLKTFDKKTLQKKCTSCHVTEGWKVFTKAKKEFDHNGQTRFPLTGKHIPLKCDECHRQNGKQVFRFQNASKQFCVSCHDNIHKGQFSNKFSAKSCAECHDTNTFKKILPFNHNKTRFKLTGQHKKIEAKCVECHKRSNFVLKTKPRKRGHQFVFKNADKNFCINCHNNVHEQQFHKKFSEISCDHCHVTENFRTFKKFNHSETNFPIRGEHKKNACSKCHKRTIKRFKEKPFRRMRKFIFPHLKQKDCHTCHKDVHKGNMGPRCSECHNELGWKKTQDFHKNFSLNGVHFTLQCAECHVDRRSLGGMSENCFMCHQKDDIHQGTLPNCGDCHRQQFWEITAFKHSLSQFPLRGAHRVLDCAACHARGIYDGTPSECIDCHLSDKNSVTSPNHSLPGFEDCKQCHNQFAFPGALQN